jgi:hypothetical protein
MPNAKETWMFKQWDRGWNDGPAAVQARPPARRGAARKQPRFDETWLNDLYNVG